MPLKQAQLVFKPFEYPWAYDAWLLQQQIHWIIFNSFFGNFQAKLLGQHAQSALRQSIFSTF